jgi:hypothetical protein
LLVVVHHGHESNLRSEFKEREGITQIAPDIYTPVRSKLGREQTRNAESAQ